MTHLPYCKCLLLIILSNMNNLGMKIQYKFTFLYLSIQMLKQVDVSQNNK